MRYRALFDLRIQHPYFADDRCSDFRIEASPHTHNLLKNHRCVFKALPDGVRVSAAVTDADQMFIPFSPAAEFTFLLYLESADFALYTDLSAISSIPSPIYTNTLASAGNPVELTLGTREAHTTEEFMIQQPAPDDQFTLAGRPLASLQANAFNVAGLGGGVTSYDSAAKVITVDTQARQPNTTFSVIYPTQPVQGQGVFAQVNIQQNTSLPPIADGPGAFVIRFQAKPVRWQYYVITDQANGDFQIEDRTSSAPIRFSADNRTDLVQQPDPNDAVAVTLARQFPEKRRLRFLSDAPLFCQQEPRKSLQLRLDGTIVVDILPNPALSNHAVVPTNNSQKEAALFQVIKYFSHQLSIN